MVALVFDYKLNVFKFYQGKLVCDLDKHKSTKQIYFRCHETILADEHSKASTNNHHLHHQQQHVTIKTKIESESNLINYHLKTSNKIVFLIIENDNLFPSWSSMANQQQQQNSTVADMIKFVDYKLLMRNEDNLIEDNDVNANKNRTCAQYLDSYSQR